MPMVSVRTLSKDDWARYALLVIYAWDMCDLNQDPASNVLDPRISADGWTVVGIISGRDNVLATAPSARLGIPPQNAGLRQSMVRPGADIRRYGYLAVNAAGDTYAAVIRGTDGAEEWIDDVVFIAEQRPQFPGRVEGGFTDIYLSMEYRPLAGWANRIPRYWHQGRGRRGGCAGLRSQPRFDVSRMLNLSACRRQFAWTIARRCDHVRLSETR